MQQIRRPRVPRVDAREQAIPRAGYLISDIWTPASTWWSQRGGPTRLHSEPGRETPQRPGYCPPKGGRAGRRQVWPGVRRSEVRGQRSESRGQRAEVGKARLLGAAPARPWLSILCSPFWAATPKTGSRRRPASCLVRRRHDSLPSRPGLPSWSVPRVRPSGQARGQALRSLTSVL